MAHPNIMADCWLLVQRRCWETEDQTTHGGETGNDDSSPSPELLLMPVKHGSLHLDSRTDRSFLHQVHVGQMILLCEAEDPEVMALINRIYFRWKISSTKAVCQASAHRDAAASKQRNTKQVAVTGKGFAEHSSLVSDQEAPQTEDGVFYARGLRQMVHKVTIGTGTKTRTNTRTMVNDIWMRAEQTPLTGS